MSAHVTALSPVDRVLFRAHADHIPHARPLREFGPKPSGKGRRFGLLRLAAAERAGDAMHIREADVGAARSLLADVPGCEIYRVAPALAERWAQDGLRIAVDDARTVLHVQIRAQVEIAGAAYEMAYRRTIPATEAVLPPSWSTDPELPRHVSRGPDPDEWAEIASAIGEIERQLPAGARARGRLHAALASVDADPERPLRRALGALRHAAGAARARDAGDLEADRVAMAFDLERYAGGFTEARKIHRRLVVHVGPTNSGKTHAAMDALEQAGEGVYLGPLRLLALEARDALARRGLAADLVTGEERERVPGSRFRASTVEVNATSPVVPAAVLDEGQMLTEPHRGWAWTAAVLGLAAREVHVTGAPEMVAPLGRLADHVGDDLELRQYDRKTPLGVASRPVAVDALARGDAVIAFSRREVMEWRSVLVARGWRVALVYGALGPEVRRGEAARFRDGDADILVATDAVGMGLNLPIRRIVFTRLSKFDGVRERALESAEIKQIAGRAGRYGFADRGIVAAMSAGDATRLRAAMGAPPTATFERVRVAPDDRHLWALARLTDGDELARLLGAFDRLVVRDHPLFEMTPLVNRIEIAAAADAAGLPLADKIVYSCAPVDGRRGEGELLARMMREHAQGGRVEAPVGVPAGDPRKADDRGLAEAERAIAQLSLYAWLALRWPGVYADGAMARARRDAWTAFMRTAFAGTPIVGDPSGGRA